MCGIVGFITNETKKGEMSRCKFLKQGLIVDTLRGDDSTGVFAVGHEPLYDDGTAYWLKSAVAGHDFVNDEDYWKNLYDVSPYRCVVGHNRAATVGAVDQKNAHPFQVGAITLVHNGTLRQTHMLKTPMHKLKDEHNVEVDSLAIAHNLAGHELKETKAVLEEIRGAYALVWHDARNDSINIIRNSERPLHFGVSKWDDTLYFMSEGTMLDFMDRRLKLGVESIYEPAKYQWLKWLPETPLTQPEVVEIEEPYSYWGGQQGYTSYGTYGAGYGAYDDDDEYDSYTAQTHRPKAEAPKDERASWIFVGGRKKPVPETQQLALIEHDMVPEDRLEFVPENYSRKMHSKNSGKNGAMMGTVTNSLGQELSCLIPTVHERVSDMMDRSWTVRPIGIRFAEEDEVIVLAKLSKLRYERPAAPSESTTSTALAVVDDGKVRGPWGQRIPVEEWYAKTTGGCDVCGRPLSIHEADDIVWTPAGTSAHCGNCAYYTVDEDGVIVMH